MGIVQNLTGFFIARFFLGVTESGLFPGVVYYFSMWYQRRERQFRISLFFGCAALAGSFGGILAYVSGRVMPFLFKRERARGRKRNREQHVNDDSVRESGKWQE